MLNYKNVQINLSEANGFGSKGNTYRVTRTDGLVFRASSVYGESYALNAQDAVEGAKKQIDRNVP